MSNPVLQLRNLHKYYGKSVHALRGVDLEFESGEFVVVIGPSGAGKSTMIRCINRLIEPSEGEIVFDGQHFEHLKGSDLRKQRADIGMIFQHYNLVSRVNVIQNVLHGKLGRTASWKTVLGLYSRQQHQEAYDLLERVGLETYLHKRADALSGGQMQRVGICRAILQNPKLLLADEPIASLDPNSADIVMDLIQSITRERKLTCIVNLHQVEYARRYASRIIGLKDGVVVFDGTPENLDDETVAEIYRGREQQMYLGTDNSKVSVAENAGSVSAEEAWYA